MVLPQAVTRASILTSPIPMKTPLPIRRLLATSSATSSISRLPPVLLALAVLLGQGMEVRAIDILWNGLANDGIYQTGGNWNGGDPLPTATGRTQRSSARSGLPAPYPFRRHAVSPA